MKENRFVFVFMEGALLSNIDERCLPCDHDCHPFPVPPNRSPRGRAQWHGKHGISSHSVWRERKREGRGEKKPIISAFLGEIFLFASFQQFLRTSLHYAAKLGHYGVACILLEEGAMLEAKNNVRNRCSPQMVCSVVDGVLLAQVGCTPLHYAAREGCYTVAELLLEHGASADPRDMYGWCPLHAAAEAGSHATVAALLAHGADPDARGQVQRTGRLG